MISRILFIIFYKITQIFSFTKKRLYGYSKAKTKNNQQETQKNNDKMVDDSAVFSILKKSTQNIINNEIQKNTGADTSDTRTDSGDSFRLKRINRGLSARRYLRNLTKNWDQNLLDSFISDGKLNERNVYEKDENSLKRKRVAEDDLSLLRPLAYRFDQTWLSATVDMRSYKFLKAQDFDLNNNS